MGCTQLFLSVAETYWIPFAVAVSYVKLFVIVGVMLLDEFFCGDNFIKDSEKTFHYLFHAMDISAIGRYAIVAKTYIVYVAFCQGNAR